MLTSRITQHDRTSPHASNNRLNINSSIRSDIFFTYKFACVFIIVIDDDPPLDAHERAPLRGDDPDPSPSSSVARRLARSNAPRPSSPHVTISRGAERASTAAAAAAATACPSTPPPCIVIASIDVAVLARANRITPNHTNRPDARREYSAPRRWSRSSSPRPRSVDARRTARRRRDALKKFPRARPRRSVAQSRPRARARAHARAPQTSLRTVVSRARGCRPRARPRRSRARTWAFGGASYDVGAPSLGFIDG